MNETAKLAAAMARDALEHEEKRDELFALVSDRNADLTLRRAALQALAQLAFNRVTLGERNVQLIATLRGLIDDPDPELRETAIEILAQRKDELVQRRLLDGLERREPPLVADSQAIVFLSYDIHGAFFPTMRRLAKESPDPDTRREAVRFLAADTGAADLLLEIFDDRGEDDEIRRASGSALLSVAPQTFEQRAKEAVLDESETEQVRAASLTSLTHFANADEVAGDSGFVAAVSNVAAPSEPAVFEESVSPREGDFAKALRMFKERHGLS